MFQKIFLVAGVALAGLALTVMFSALFALPVMWLWNFVIPEVFKLPMLNFYQAWALLLLTSLLVKSSGGSSSKS